VPPSRLRETGTLEFIHPLTSRLGGICAAGFAIEDVCEPDHTLPAAVPGSFAHRAAFVPPYLRVLARRRWKNRDGSDFSDLFGAGTIIVGD